MSEFVGFLLGVVALVSSIMWATSVFEIIGATTEVYVWYFLSVGSVMLSTMLTMGSNR